VPPIAPGPTTAISLIAVATYLQAVATPSTVHFVAQHLSSPGLQP
jgi:hypothetical protein